jgi:hypothetical protein
VGEEWLDDCLGFSFRKKNLIIVCGGILAASGKKILVIWEEVDWGAVSVQAYVNNMPIPYIWPFWYWESINNGP